MPSKLSSSSVSMEMSSITRSVSRCSLSCRLAIVENGVGKGGTACPWACASLRWAKMRPGEDTARKGCTPVLDGMEFVTLDGVVPAVFASTSLGLLWFFLFLFLPREISRGTGSKPR